MSSTGNSEAAMQTHNQSASKEQTATEPSPVAGRERRRVTIAAPRAAEMATRGKQMSSSPDSLTATAAGFIRAGHMLHAYVHREENLMRLRHIRGGRQCLERFIKQHPRSDSVSFPAIWNDNSRPVAALLERWIASPHNSFWLSEEGRSAKSPTPVCNRPQAIGQARAAQPTEAEAPLARKSTEAREPPTEKQEAAPIRRATAEPKPAAETQPTTQPAAEEPKLSKRQLAVSAARRAMQAAASAEAATLYAASKSTTAMAMVAEAVKAIASAAEEDGGCGCRRGREATSVLGRSYTVIYDAAPVAPAIPDAPKGSAGGRAGRRTPSRAPLPALPPTPAKSVADSTPTLLGSEADTSVEETISDTETDYGSITDCPELDALLRSDVAR